MDDFVDTLLGLLITLGVPAYLVLQVWLPRRLRKGWRIAALLPLIVFAPLLVHAVVALAAGSNLWPILIVLFAPVGCLYLLGVGVMHALRGQPPIR